MFHLEKTHGHHSKKDDGLTYAINSFTDQYHAVTSKEIMAWYNHQLQYQIAVTGATTVTYPIVTFTASAWDRHILNVGSSYITIWDIRGCNSYMETAAEKAARQKREHEAEVANSRADQLLTSLLSSDQADQYRKDKRFDLVINGRVYRINRGRTGNVQLIENGKAVAKYCAHPSVWTPDGDTLIAQMLMLKTDEAKFLQIANRTALA